MACSAFAIITPQDWPPIRTRLFTREQSPPDSNHPVRPPACQPTLIDSASRTQLDEVGLSVNDIITFNQLIGFIGFQARAIAAFQALQRLPVRWLPGLDTLQDAPAELFSASFNGWEADLPPVELHYAQTDQLEILNISQPLRPLHGIGWLLPTMLPPSGRSRN